MKRAMLVTVVSLPLLAVLTIAGFVVAGRGGGDGPSAAETSPPRSAPRGLEDLLAAGNVVVATNARSQVPALEAAASGVMGLPEYRDSPERRRRGEWIDVRYDPSAEGIVAYADDGILRVASPDELRLQDFLATSLGRG